MKNIIPFSRFGRIGLIASVIITSVLLAITFTKGFNLGIDFKSGQTIDVIVSNTSPIELQTVLSDAFEQINVTRVGNDTIDSYNIKLSATIEQQEEQLQSIEKTLKDAFGDIEIQSTSFIGSSISQNLFQSVLVLVLGALGLILLYIWLRFKLPFAVASLMALLHDILFIIGIVGVFQIEVSISTVAAILTIIGYSLNDTIVIFDRIRENIVLIREGSYADIVNKSITQTLSRTIITSTTTLLAVVALLVFATGDIFNFAKVLCIGIIEGTWSSLFIASPILSLFNNNKILQLYRKNQGSGIQYKTESNLKSEETTQQISSDSAISNKEIAKIKAEVLAKKAKRKHKK